MVFDRGERYSELLNFVLSPLGLTGRLRDAAERVYLPPFLSKDTRCLCVTLLLLAGCAARSGAGSETASKFAYNPPTSSARKPAGVDEVEQLGKLYADRHPIRTLTGKATYYSDSLAGRSMASGELYDPNRAQAAHRTLPFGTIVRVTRVGSNDKVVVRIADRGPYGAKGRIIDVSHAAAERLGIIRAGVADVRVEVLEIPSEHR